MSGEGGRIIAPRSGLHGSALALQLGCAAALLLAVGLTLFAPDARPYVFASGLPLLGCLVVLFGLEVLRVHWELSMRRLELREKLAGGSGDGEETTA